MYIKDQSAKTAVFGIYKPISISISISIYLSIYLSIYIYTENSCFSRLIFYVHKIYNIYIMYIIRFGFYHRKNS